MVWCRGGASFLFGLSFVRFGREEGRRGKGVANYFELPVCFYPVVWSNFESSQERRQGIRMRVYGAR